MSWYKVATATDIAEGGRLHVKVEGRYVTIFLHRGHLSAIDSICHHAGGPLTLGSVRDIEELGVTVVLCPWHKFMVSIDEGLKAYQAVDIVNGKPVNVGWKLGKVVQRVHKVELRSDGIYLVGELLNETALDYICRVLIVIVTRFCLIVVAIGRRRLCK
jgi:nitrite reductase/ring-hydroxylating ferredoxin subunit